MTPSIHDYDRAQIQPVGDTLQQPGDPGRTIQEDELPKASTSSAQQRGIWDSAKEIEGSNEILDQAEVSVCST